MIFGIPIADIIIGIIAVLLVGLCIYSIIRKKKKNEHRICTNGHVSM